MSARFALHSGQCPHSRLTVNNASPPTSSPWTSVPMAAMRPSISCPMTSWCWPGGASARPPAASSRSVPQIPTWTTSSSTSSPLTISGAGRSTIVRLVVPGSSAIAFTCPTPVAPSSWVRTGEDVLLNGFSKAFVLVRCGGIVGELLDFVAGVAHGDAHAGDLEHQRVVHLVTDGCHVLKWDVEELFEPPGDAAFVGVGVRDIEIVGLRPCRADLFAKLFLRGGLTPGHGVEIVADAHDFDDIGHDVVVAFHDFRRELHRPGLPVDVWRVLLLDKPVGPAIQPNIQLALAHGFDDLGHDVVGDRPLVDDR